MHMAAFYNPAPSGGIMVRDRAFVRNNGLCSLVSL